MCPLIDFSDPDNYHKIHTMIKNPVSKANVFNTKVIEPPATFSRIKLTIVHALLEYHVCMRKRRISEETKQR